MSPVVCERCGKPDPDAVLLSDFEGWSVHGDFCARALASAKGLRSYRIISLSIASAAAAHDASLGIPR